MREWTSREINRQDFVDNEIFQLIQQVNPTSDEIDWDIEMIADVRDVVQHWLVKNLELCNKQTFYPYINTRTQSPKALRKLNQKYLNIKKQKARSR
jgi:hypothetical protein